MECPYLGTTTPALAVWVLDSARYTSSGPHRRREPSRRRARMSGPLLIRADRGYLKRCPSPTAGVTLAGGYRRCFGLISSLTVRE